MHPVRCKVRPVRLTRDSEVWIRESDLLVSRSELAMSAAPHLDLRRAWSLQILSALHLYVHSNPLTILRCLLFDVS